MNIEIRKNIAYTLKLWLEWIDAGKPRPNEMGFHPFSPLCRTVMLVDDIEDMFNPSIEREMGLMFIEDGLHEHYPFNNGDHAEYAQEDDVTENEQRLSWAKSIVERYVE